MPSSTNVEADSTNPHTNSDSVEQEIVDLDAPAPEWTYGSCNALLVMRYGVPHEVVSKVIAPDVAQYCSGLRLVVRTLRHIVHTTSELYCSDHASNEDLLLLKEMKELRSFGVVGRAANEAALAAIAQATHITELSFVGASWVGVDALRHLKSLPDLQALTLSDVSASKMAHILALPSITKLDLRHQACVTGIGALRGTLTSLRLFGASLGEKKLQEIGQLTNLRTLKLDHSELALGAMMHLRSLSALTHLDLSNTLATTTDALKIVAVSFPELESLSLDNCRGVNADGLEHLSQLRNLRRLSLFGCRNVDARGVAVAKGLNIADLDTQLCGGTHSQMM